MPRNDDTLIDARAAALWAGTCEDHQNLDCPVTLGLPEWAMDLLGEEEEGGSAFDYPHEADFLL